MVQTFSVPPLAAPPFRRVRRAGLSSLLVACGLLATVTPARALSTTWIAADGGSWEAGTNWSAGVPQPQDLVVFAPPTRPTAGVTINTATSIAGLTLANANLSVRADLTVTGSASWTENGAFPGLMAFSNAPLVQFQGPFTITGDASKGVNLTGVLDLSGATTWSGNTLAGGNALVAGVNSSRSVIRNRGAFTDANGFDTNISGAGAFDNQGSFVKSGAAVTRLNVADFRNSGSVTVAAGTLVIPTMTGTHTGLWQVGAGAVLDLSGGTPTLLGPMGGAGSLRISGGTVTIEGFGHNLPVVLDGGSLAGTSQVFDGAFTWRAGALAGGGATHITGALNLEGPGTKAIGSGRQVFAYGQTTLSSGQLLAIGTSESLATSFVNNGSFMDVDDGARNLKGLSPEVSTFLNAGTYTKTGSGFTTVQSLTFDNQGTLDLHAGLMRVTGALKNTGLIRAAAGAGLLVTPASSFENQGTLTGAGSIDALGSIINRGLIAPGDPIGMLTLGSLTLGQEGTVRIDLGAADASDLLKLTGTVALGGELDLWNAGYAPRLGDSFTVLQFANRQGASGFDTVQLHGFGQGVAFDVVYGAGDVKVVVAAVPEPGTWALLLGGLAVVGGVARRRSRA